jgi:RimJ/RimL family protein N-acetyltransferase
VTLRLVPVPPGADPAQLASRLASSFGGDPEGAVEILLQAVNLLARAPRADPWGTYLAYDGDATVGLCAFKAAPDDRGAVEIAYMTFPVHERKGYAGAMAGALTSIALDAGSVLVIAHTLPEENPSNRALRANGFIFAGETIDPEDGVVWRWEKSR